MPKYFAAPGSPFTDADAAEIGPELATLASEGRSTVEDIVAHARTASPVLRRHLHMDKPVEVAAESWYRQRARSVAGSIFVNVKTSRGVEPVRAFHSVQITVADGAEVKPTRQYVTIESVRRIPELSDQVLMEIRRRLISLRDQYAVYHDLLADEAPDIAEVFEAIGRAA